MAGFTELTRRLMADRGISVRGLARLVHYDQGGMSKILRGLQPCPPYLARAIDDALEAGGEVTRAAACVPAPLVPPPLLLPGDISPVERLLGFLRVISESDNLFGPHRLIQAVREYVALIGQLRQDRSGADGRALLGVQTRYAETLAWLYQDSGSWRAAQYWLDRALEWAHMCGDMQWAAYVLARKSQLAGDMHDPVAAVDLADAAARLAGGGRLMAAGAAYQAHGHALAGGEAASLRALDTARVIAGTPADDPDVPWSPWLDTGYVDAQRARCLTVLGNHAAAIPLFGEAIAQMPPALHRDRGVYTARQAIAQAGAGDIDAAAGSGMTALSVLQLTGSGRIAAELHILDAALRREKTHPAAAGFRRALGHSARPGRPHLNHAPSPEGL